MPFVASIVECGRWDLARICSLCSVGRPAGLELQITQREIQTKITKTTIGQPTVFSEQTLSFSSSKFPIKKKRHFRRERCVDPQRGVGLLRLTKDIPTPRVVVVVILTSPRLAVSRDVVIEWGHRLLLGDQQTELT